MRIITEVLKDKIIAAIDAERRAGRTPKAVELTPGEFNQLCDELGYLSMLQRAGAFAERKIAGLPIKIVPTPTLGSYYGTNVFIPRAYEYTNDGG